jgi:hypothetical protein
MRAIQGVFGAEGHPGAGGSVTQGAGCFGAQSLRGVAGRDGFQLKSRAFVAIRATKREPPLSGGEKAVCKRKAISNQLRARNEATGQIATWAAAAAVAAQTRK